MSDAEYFLMAWAVLATIFAGYCWGKAKAHYLMHRRVAVLVAELAFGDIKAVLRDDGFMVVENEDMRMTFRKRGEE